MWGGTPGKPIWGRRYPRPRLAPDPASLAVWGRVQPPEEIEAAIRQSAERRALIRTLRSIASRAGPGLSAKESRQFVLREVKALLEDIFPTEPWTEGWSLRSGIYSRGPYTLVELFPGSTLPWGIKQDGETIMWQKPVSKNRRGEVIYRPHPVRHERPDSAMKWINDLLKSGRG